MFSFSFSILLLFIVSVSCSKRYCVSTTEGNDTVTCGDINSPCLTLDFLVDKIIPKPVSDDLHIMLYAKEYHLNTDVKLDAGDHYIHLEGVNGFQDVPDFYLDTKGSIQFISQSTTNISDFRFHLSSTKFVDLGPTGNFINTKLRFKSNTEITANWMRSGSVTLQYTTPGTCLNILNYYRVYFDSDDGFDGMFNVFKKNSKSLYFWDPTFYNFPILFTNQSVIFDYVSFQGYNSRNTAIKLTGPETNVELHAGIEVKDNSKTGSIITIFDGAKMTVFRDKSVPIGTFTYISDNKVDAILTIYGGGQFVGEYLSFQSNTISKALFYVNDDTSVLKISEGQFFDNSEGTILWTETGLGTFLCYDCVFTDVDKLSQFVECSPKKDVTDLEFTGPKFDVVPYLTNLECNDKCTINHGTCDKFLKDYGKKKVPSGGGGTLWRLPVIVGSAALVGLCCLCCVPFCCLVVVVVLGLGGVGVVVLLVLLGVCGGGGVATVTTGAVTTGIVTATKKRGKEKYVAINNDIVGDDYL